jgi:uncharacterized protein YndB with AHSA1/START domain
MALQEIDVRSRSAAEPATVWRLLGDSETWPDWTPIDEAEIERRASADGLGEIRSFKTGRVTVREEIVERVENRRLTYVLLGGLAVKDYRAEIDLEPDDGGTAIRWHTTFRGKVPGTGWLYRRALDRITREFLDGLIAHSNESQAPAPGH